MTRRVLALALFAASLASEAAAWPVSLMESLARDARRLVPRSLALLMQKHEREILEEAQRLPPELGQALSADLHAGRLQPGTLAAAETRAAESLALFKQQRVSEGAVRLGALLRIPADVSDPVLSVGPLGYPPGVTREYYAFISNSLDKIPVVLDDPPTLKLQRRELPDYWGRLLGRSRADAPVIRIELFQAGRVVSHRSIDYRSPVFGVASLSYSRAVNAIAATWLAVWREARGDLTLQPAPVTVQPREAHQ